jgi:hypothetical protein
MGILSGIFRPSPEIVALRNNLAAQRARTAQAAYQRLLDENAAAVETMREMWEPRRKSNGGPMPDGIVDGEIAAFKSSLDGVANDLRRNLDI